MATKINEIKKAKKSVRFIKEIFFSKSVINQPPIPFNISISNKIYIKLTNSTKSTLSLLKDILF